MGERDTLFVEVCVKVKQQLGVDQMALAAPSRHWNDAAYRPRGEAMPSCLKLHQASHAEVGRLFCLAIGSVGVTLTQTPGARLKAELIDVDACPLCQGFRTAACLHGYRGAMAANLLLAQS
jgi:hypothetical protein